MQTLKIIVVDFVDHRYSNLIKSLNDFYPNSISQKQQHFDGTVASLSLDEEDIRILFMLASAQRDFIWELHIDSADAFVFVLPCDKPEVFKEAQELAQVFFNLAPLPLVIVTCNNDIANLSDERVRLYLSLSNLCPIVPYIPDKKAIRYIILRIAEAMLEHMELFSD